MPLRRVVSELAKDVSKQFSNEDLTRYFYDVKDHIDKVLETLDGSRETIEIYKDTDFMLSSQKSNKILSVLTILFTLSIPVTVISTFLRNEWYIFQVITDRGLDLLGSLQHFFYSLCGHGNINCANA